MTTSKPYRLGLIVVASETGLGYQTRDYYNHLKPDKTILIDISSLNGTKQHYEWYENATVVRGIPKDHELEAMLEGIDVLLTAETPYNLNLYAVARRMGVKTICVENPEFYDHQLYPQYELPDLIILPSVWLEPTIRRLAEPRGAKVVQIHHPVDRQAFPYRQRTTARFMHIAGRPATNDRNGTYDFLQACPDGIVTTQNGDLAWQLRRKYRHSNVYTNVNDANYLYQLGDVMVMPRRYGGNCLPLNEALSSGMPVIMPDISPNNNLLPSEWLVPATKTGHFTPRFDVDIYSVDIAALTAKLNEFRSLDIAAESEKANAIADTISWQTLLPKWRAAIESVL